VWLGASTSGSLVVIKFSTETNTEEARRRLEKEAQRWRDIWHTDARVVVLLSVPALLMPFSFHCRLTPEGVVFLVCVFD
jgi:Family of unknown function (DUF5898)